MYHITVSATANQSSQDNGKTGGNDFTEEGTAGTAAAAMTKRPL